MSESELIEEPREITARYLPNEGGIMWEGKAYLPADYVLNEDREPSDAYVKTLAREFERVWDERVETFDPEKHDEMPFIEGIMRDSLLAAQEVRGES